MKVYISVLSCEDDVVSENGHPIVVTSLSIEHLRDKVWDALVELYCDNFNTDWDYNEETPHFNKNEVSNKVRESYWYNITVDDLDSKVQIYTVCESIIS